MLRKISFAIAGTMLVAGAAVAAPTSSFPVSVNETGPNQGGITAERAGAFASAAASRDARSITWEVRTPISVSETGPNYPALATERTSAPIGATAASEVIRVR